jgi:hypothetical protein
MLRAMANKLFISNYTYRTEEQQLAVLATDPHLVGAPVYRPADLSTVMRPTQRVTRDTLYAASVACFAEGDDGLKKLIADCRKRNTCLASIQEGFSWTPQQSTGLALKAWKTARINGAAKVGAMLSARKREAESEMACDYIRPKWRLPNSQYSTDELLKLAGEVIHKKKISYNTAIKFLGKRPIAQYNYQIKQKRKERYERAT